MKLNLNYMLFEVRHGCVIVLDYKIVPLYAGIILGMGSFNEGRHYNVMSFLNGWAYNLSASWEYFARFVLYTKL